ncbi:MAG: undecaprenyl-phosphate glucose phosphotransferase, partial [Alphaproteobacteria bacterium]
MLLGMIIYFIYVQQAPGIDWLYTVPIVGGPFVAILFIQLADGYSVPALRAVNLHLGRIFAAWTLLFAIFTIVAFLAKIGDNYSRVWIGTWYLAGLAAFTFIRIVLSRLVGAWTQAGRLERRAVIVGGGDLAVKLIGALEAQTDNDIRICGVFDDRSDERSPQVVAGYPKLGTFDELVDFGRIARIDMLIVSLPITAESRLFTLLKRLWVLPVDIRLSAHAAKIRFRPRSYSFVGTVPLFDVFDKPITDWDRIAKRAFDIFFASVGLVMLAPVMALTALAVRLDSPGPALFRQRRYGFNNEMVEVYKFRSMYVDQTDQSAAKLVTRGDPRVTRVGRFIRKTSLDELPQFFNALKGDLSLVGPRPHATNAKADNELYENVVDGYFARHRVKPGITGWAQINGWRGETDTQEKIEYRVRHDLYYIENWSVLLDLYILF